jgi:hypothetical protein
VAIRGGGATLAGFAAVPRGRLQFWQAPHDFKGLSRETCHKIALVRGRVGAGRRLGGLLFGGAGAGLVGFVPVVRALVQFWQGPHDFKGLSRETCHKIAFVRSRVRAG